LTVGNLAMHADFLLLVIDSSIKFSYSYSYC